MKILFISTCLIVMMACTEETSSQATHHPTTPVEAPQKEVAAEQAKGEAYFESGIKAAEADNMPQAFNDFLSAAKAGHDLGQFNVALMYEQGLGVSKDEKEAFSWYEKSASQGNSAAQFNLGVLYENGRGKTVDFAKANEWYRQAALQGDGLAVGNLGMLYIRGQGVKQNLVAGVALLMLSTSMDNSPENQAKSNIAATRGLTVDIVTEAQTLSDEMSQSRNLLEPLDSYLNR